MQPFLHLGAVNRTAFLFPGQGSQKVGMTQELVDTFSQARAALEEADAVLGFSLSRLMLEGPEEELTDTLNAQPALLAAGVAAMRALEAEVGDALSLGGRMSLSPDTAWGSTRRWWLPAASAMRMGCGWCANGVG